MKLLEMFPSGPSSMVGIWESVPSESTDSLLKFRRNTGSLPEVLEGIRAFAGLEKTGIVYDKNGKPYLSDPAKGFISISHSKNLIALSYDTKHPTGIDVELMGEKIVRIQHKFLSDEELSRPGLRNASVPLHIYWGVKESIYKYYGKRGLIFSQNIHVLPFEMKFPGEVRAVLRVSGKEITCTLRYELRTNFMLVYMINA